MPRTTSTMTALASSLIVSAAMAAGAFGHAERETEYPDHTKGSVPEYRTTGPGLIVCKPDSRQRILRMTKVRRGDRSAGARRTKRLRKRNLSLLRRCKYHHVQAAVDAAGNGYRILILPGVYREEPSEPAKHEPSCGEPLEKGAKPYEYHVKCPHVENLIAILGDSPDDADRECDRKCNLQIEGTGAKPRDVQILGRGYGNTPGAKYNVIRADRADGIYLRNFFTQYSDFNNVYVLETNGFAVVDVVSGYSREYSILSFVSDNGLYDRVEAYGGGDSALYPGSGPEGHCKRYGIEVRNSDIHHSPVGISGTSGNGWWIHHNRIHHTETGIGIDSFTPNHPGMPQDCSKITDNFIYSNNERYHDQERTEYCKNTPVEERDPEKICPTYFAVPGTGIVIGGGNDNLVERNYMWDNWRFAVAQIGVPAVVREELDPAKQTDTSHGNRYVDNFLSMTPDGRRDPNGRDFWWDEQGARNCFSDNTTMGAGQPDSLGAIYECPGSPFMLLPHPIKYAFIAPCLNYHPTEDPDPVGCMIDGRPMFETPPEPQ